MVTLEKVNSNSGEEELLSRRKKIAGEGSSDAGVDLDLDELKLLQLEFGLSELNPSQRSLNPPLLRSE